ncbi:hypothetical protein NA56DRAFT_701626 [Hyaloscypha hepaticicola]|uniref:Uncharacterized protein n=1 Tax=Hyaloscypha hepaticicola TaxID=2082293 RepID=A0A2J6QAP0_9HELO|nr:hypothetical protein NA56DRAFT_701626 [Hyaloscypha hepaticicola]
MRRDEMRGVSWHEWKRSESLPQSLSGDAMKLLISLNVKPDLIWVILLRVADGKVGADVGVAVIVQWPSSRAEEGRGFVAAWRLTVRHRAYPRDKQSTERGENRIISRKLAVASAAVCGEHALSGQAADLCNSARLHCAFRGVLHEACDSNQYANRCPLARNKGTIQRGTHVRTGKARARTGMESRSQLSAITDCE